MIGTIIGDIVGSRFETEKAENHEFSSKCFKDDFFWRRNFFLDDDTQIFQ